MQSTSEWRHQVRVADGRVVVVVKEVENKNNYPNYKHLWLYTKSSVGIGYLSSRTMHTLHEVKSV